MSLMCLRIYTYKYLRKGCKHSENRLHQIDQGVRKSILCYKLTLSQRNLTG